jgi:hypothetical protein
MQNRQTRFKKNLLSFSSTFLFNRLLHSRANKAGGFSSENVKNGGGNWIQEREKIGDNFIKPRSASWE